MRKSSIVLILAVLGISAFATIGAGAHDGCNSGGHRHTASGSCKDTDDWDIDCSDEGALPVSAGSLRGYVTETSDGAEVEVCNDEGAGTTHGQVVVKVNTEDGYARATLNSDEGQKPNVSAGYINVQAGPGPDQTGVWCSAEPEDADGYDQPVNDPGTEGGTTPDQWAECIPTM